MSEFSESAAIQLADTQEHSNITPVAEVIRPMLDDAMCYFGHNRFLGGPEALCASICAQWIKAGWGAGGGG